MLFLNKSLSLLVCLGLLLLKGLQLSLHCLDLGGIVSNQLISRFDSLSDLVDNSLFLSLHLA
jgi:hypothetical protein